MQSDFVGYLWPVAIVAGPVLLALVFAYGVINVRRRRQVARTPAVDTATPDVREQRAGTRHVMMWAVAAAAVLFVIVMVWPFLPNNGRPQNGNPELAARTCSNRPQSTIQNCASLPSPQSHQGPPKP